MLSEKKSEIALRNLFQKNVVTDMQGLFETLETRSRMSVFRRLKRMKYFSSYTHSGRYYTLSTIPKFNKDGLWFYQEIGYSRFGTLKSTIIALIERSKEGLIQADLQSMLRVRVQDTLLGLYRNDTIRREKVGGAYVYLCSKKSDAKLQLRSRREAGIKMVTSLTLAVKLEVFMEAIKECEIEFSADSITAKLNAKDINISLVQVRNLLKRHGIRVK